MGTRYLVAVHIDGEYKVAQFGAYDGYPEGAGVSVLNFLRSLKEENKIKAFIEKVKSCRFYLGNYDLTTDEDYGCGEDILIKILNGCKGYELVNSISFAADSLFCEWCCVIDFDTMTFEGYKGFNQTRYLAEKDRFYFLEPTAKYNKNGYHPVYLIHKWSFDDLPEKDLFIEAMRNKQQEVEETKETKQMQKGIQFDTFDTVRYVFLRQKQFSKYCLDIVIKNTVDDKFKIIVPDYPYKSSYNENKTYVINLHTNKIYTAVPYCNDEYDKLTGMAVAFAKATNKRIPILIKKELFDVEEIEPNMQLLIWEDKVKKPYNKNVTTYNIKETIKILSKSNIVKMYVI